MHPRLIAGASLVAFVLGAWLPRPAAAQGVGAIGGTLTDASGALLPGVTVTLVSAGTIGGNQEVLTGERGTYQFTRLVPGRYGVKAAPRDSAPPRRTTSSSPPTSPRGPICGSRSDSWRKASSCEARRRCSTRRRR